MKQFCFLAFALLLNATISRGQGTVPKVEDLVKVPASPEAQAFAKYGNTPANLYSGTPSISVPIGNLKGREIEIPISLSYDASGIKVEQIATWVGLGWNLNVGGMVTRQVNGLPDDYFNSTPPHIPFYHPSIKSDYDFVRDFSPAENTTQTPGLLKRYLDFLNRATRTPSSEKLELQPDTYSFHVLGLSGTLFIDYDNQTAYCIESPEIKAIPGFQASGAVQIIINWTITDTQGNIYYFESAEKTSVEDKDPLDGHRTYNSAWVLTRIESRNTRDIILFNYNSPPIWGQEQLAGRGEMRNDFLAGSQCGSDIMIPGLGNPTYKIEQKELASIVVNGKTQAQFLAPASRLDLAGKNLLSQIILKNSDGAITNQYILNQSYFGSPSTNEKDLRLRLDGIEIHGSTIGNPQTYQFTYNSGLPSRESMAQDFWGYYNGKSNGTLIPYNYDFDIANVGFTGANRRPVFSTTTAGILTNIKYPTGGSTEFNYGPHKLPPDGFSYQEEYILGSASLKGGVDPTDPFHYIGCDDPVGPPMGIETEFEVSEAASFNLDVNIVNSKPNEPTNGQMHYFALYYAGSIHSVSRTFCDLFQNGNTVRYLHHQGTSAPSSTLSEQVGLQPGFYRIMILNTDTSVKIDVTITGTHTISAAQSPGAGVRLKSMVDKDIDGEVLSKRYLFYGDLSTIPTQNITEAFVSSSANQATGILHPYTNFEEDRIFDEGACSSLYRSGTNKTQSSYFITYDKVSEISFDGLGNHSGFTVTEFVNGIDNWSGGFSRKAINNGKVIGKQVFNSNGNLLSKEINNYILDTVVSGTVGFYFYSNKSTQKDTYIKSDYVNPTGEFYTTQLPLNGAHCGDDGTVSSIFSGANYHENLFNDHFLSITNCQIDYKPNPSHPARIYYESLGEGVQRTMRHYAATGSSGDGLVAVGKKAYNIIFCYQFGSEYNKMQSVYSRYWPKLLSSQHIQYSGQDSVVSTTTYLYENSTHFQVTSTQKDDSKGSTLKTQLFYADEMQTAEPANPIWPLLIAKNRIAEKIQSKTFKDDTQLLNTEKTLYTQSGSMVLPLKIQFSKGTNDLEDRVDFLQYDANGNPTEVARTNDVKVAIRYGYNQTQIIAQAKNASVNQIFHTSFEGEEGGNSTDNDSRTGRTSKVGGYSKTLIGLTNNMTYVLSYWQKVNGVWGLQSQLVPLNSSTTSYTITLTGQVDEIRFYPQGAQMTTFTYNPSVGITSSTDANDISIYYEYDGFNRLKLIKDDKANILKTFNYHYYNGQ